MNEDMRRIRRELHDMAVTLTWALVIELVLAALMLLVVWWVVS